MNEYESLHSCLSCNALRYKKENVPARRMCTILDDAKNLTWHEKERLKNNDHQYRRQKRKFNGEVEEKIAPTPLTGQQCFSDLSGVKLAKDKIDEV
ncbi:hypothetical protein V2J09_009061 [Rumex salicifolius]